MPESHTRCRPLSRLVLSLATRISYLPWEIPRVAEVMTQPSCGWLVSMPSGLVRCSVVSEPTYGGAESAAAAAGADGSTANQPISVATAISARADHRAVGRRLIRSRDTAAS